MAPTSYYKWADLPQVEMTPKIRRRLVSGEKLMSVYFTLDEGAIVAEHQHPHEQITHVLSGRLEFEVNGEKRVIGAGEVVCIPSNAPHRVTVLEDTTALDVFSPPREDFLTGEKPDYMK